MKYFTAHCLSSKLTYGKVTSGTKITDETSFTSTIIYAEDLMEIDLTGIENTKVKAVVVKKGSFAGHTSVYLNQFGIQLCICSDLGIFVDDCWYLIDGEKDEVVRGEKSEIENAYLKRKSKQENCRQSFDSEKNTDRQIRVLVDGTSSDQLERGLVLGANGIGILRTDRLCLNRSNPPSRVEVIDFFKSFSKVRQTTQLNVRLYDLGGDKIPDWCHEKADKLRSPLGARGVRAWEYLPALFEDQLAAIVEIGTPAKPVGVVIPMVTDDNDIEFVRTRLSSYKDARSVTCLSAMVETPSSVLVLGSILSKIDEIRIGPGDLTQFTLGKLREGLTPAEFSRSGFHPAVQELIQETIEVANSRDVPVSLCLDLEPKIEALENLLGLGVRTFCVAPESIGVTRRLLSEILS